MEMKIGASEEGIKWNSLTFLQCLQSWIKINSVVCVCMCWCDMWDGLKRFTPERAWHAGASSHIFSFLCVCMSTHLCGFSWRPGAMWKREAGCSIMYQCLIALIYGQMEHGGSCDGCDNKQRMKMVGRERRNVRSVRVEEWWCGKRMKRNKVLSAGSQDCVSVVSNHWLERFMCSHLQQHRRPYPPPAKLPFPFPLSQAFCFNGQTAMALISSVL